MREGCLGLEHMKPTRTCLVVDDSELIRKVACVYLEQLGYLVSQAESGDAALSRLEVELPDLILIDWCMPGLPSRETIARIRAHSGGDYPTVVYLTTQLDHHDIAEAKLAGANAYLLKPFNRADFVGKMNELTLKRLRPSAFRSDGIGSAL